MSDLTAHGVSTKCLLSAQHTLFLSPQFQARPRTHSTSSTNRTFDITTMQRHFALHTLLWFKAVNGVITAVCLAEGSKLSLRRQESIALIFFRQGIIQDEFKSKETDIIFSFPFTLIHSFLINLVLLFYICRPLSFGVPVMGQELDEIRKVWKKDCRLVVVGNYFCGYALYLQFTQLTLHVPIHVTLWLVRPRLYFIHSIIHHNLFQRYYYLIFLIYKLFVMSY